MKILNNIINYINSQGRFKSSDELILNAFFFHLASYSSLINPTIIFKNKQLPVNYFGISIAGSASGKSFVYSEAKKLFPVDKWKKAIEYSYNVANADLDNDEITIDGIETKLKNFLPNYENTIEGTREGIYLRALAISRCFSGSLNIINEEIMDIIRDSNLNVMKEIYDGMLLGKVIKGSTNENIYGIRANMLIFGSSVGMKRDQKVYETFLKALNSGIYRRSFIYYEEPRDIEMNDLEQINKPDMSLFFDFISSHKSVLSNGLPTIIELSSDAYELSELINQELIEFSNRYKEDERFSAEVGSFDKIIKLSGLLVMLNGSNIITYDELSYAYKFYKKLRDTNKNLFNVEPQHKRIYQVLKKIGKATKSEILEQDIFNRITFNEDILLVEEQCYRNNERLVITGSKIKFYSIEPMEQSSIEKIIVSLPKVDKKEKTTEYNSYQLPFFGEDKPSIERVVKSEKVSNFVLVHFDKGKRKKENAIHKINCVGLDVDYGFSLNDASNILSKWGIKYLIYTTRNHQKEKNGIVCDRFRILIPLRYTIEIEPDRFGSFVENIADGLGIKVIDTNALDISRLWFTNPKAQIIKNQSGSLFDPIPFLPETEVDEKIEAITEEIDNEEAKKRVNGMIRWVVANSIEGNRNNNLLRLGLFVLDLTGSKDITKSVILQANSQLSEPLDEREIRKTIFKTIERR